MSFMKSWAVHCNRVACVKHTMRAGRVPITIIRGTMDAVGKAGRFFEGLAAAGKAAVEEAKKQAATPIPEKQVEETKPPQ